MPYLSLHDALPLSWPSWMSFRSSSFWRWRSSSRSLRREMTTFMRSGSILMMRARIIKIDPERMNVVISRRKLLEEERQRQKEELLKDIQEGQESGRASCSER